MDADWQADKNMSEQAEFSVTEWILVKEDIVAENWGKN